MGLTCVLTASGAGQLPDVIRSTSEENFLNSDQITYYMSRQPFSLGRTILVNASEQKQSLECVQLLIAAQLNKDQLRSLINQGVLRGAANVKDLIIQNDGATDFGKIMNPIETLDKKAEPEAPQIADRPKVISLGRFRKGASQSRGNPRRGGRL